MSLLAQDERLTRRVGAITLLLLAASILFVLFVLDHIEIGSPTRIRIYFHHSAGLREHAPLVVGGQPIGRIEALMAVPRGAATPLGGELGTVAVVTIDEGEVWKVPADAEVFVSSRGILSEKYLEVAAPRGEPGPSVREGEQLRGSDPPSLDTVLSRTWANMITFRAFVEEVGPELTALREGIAVLAAELAGDPAADAALLARIAPLVARARGLVAEAGTTYDRALGGQRGTDRLAVVLEDTRATITAVRATLDRLAPIVAALRERTARVSGHLAAHDPLARLDETITRARAVITKLDPLLAIVADLRGRLARGEGSLGRIMTDPEFPEDAKAIGKVLKRQPWRVIGRPKD